MPDIFDLSANKGQARPVSGDIFDVSAASDPNDTTTVGQFKAQPMMKPPDNRGLGPFDLPSNAWKDIADMGPAMRTMGSLVKARMWESSPQGTHPGMLFRPARLSANEPSDFEAMGAIGKGIYDQYKQTYWDPMVGGRATEIPQYWYKHPVTGFMADALPFVPIADTVGIPAAIAKGAGSVAAKAAPMLAKGTNAAVNAIEKGVESENAIVRATAGLGANIIGDKARGKMLNPYQQVLKAEGNDFINKLKPLYSQIPNQMKQARAELGGVSDVQAYAEGWHPSLHAGQAMPPQVRAYLDAAEGFNQTMRDRIGPLKDPATLDQERWMPMVLKLNADKYARIKDIPAQEVPALIQDAQARAQKLGIEPVYSPWLQPGSVAKHNSQAPWDLSGKLGDIQNAVTEKSGSGKNLNPNHLENLKVRWDEIGQYFHAKKTLLEQMIDASQTLTPELQQGLLDGTHATYDLGKLKEAVARLAIPDATPDQIKVAMQSVPDKVVLPKPDAMALDTLANNKPLLRGSLMSFSQQMASLQKRYLLGGNPFYPETQLGQNIFVLSMLQFNGLRDTMTTLAAWGMTMTNRQAWKIVPMSITGVPDFGQTGFKLFEEAAGLARNKVPGLRLAGNVVANVGKGVETVIDANQWRMAVYDAVTRLVAANKIALELAYQDKKLGVMLKDVASVSRALVNMRKVYNNPATYEKVAETVIKQLGDFSSAANNGKFMKLARQIFLWPTYFKYITELAMRFPFEHPYKNVLLTRVQEASRKLYNDERMPDYLQEAGTYMLPNVQTDQGYSVGINGGSLHPFGPVPELMKLYMDMSDSYGQPTVLGMMTPLAIFGQVMATKKNPMTGRDFNDPRNVQSGREQYKPSDVNKAASQLAGGLDVDLEAVHPVPNPYELLARSTFSYYTRGAETIFEMKKSGGARSAFTSPLSNESAPRMTGIMRNEVLHPPKTAIPDAILNMPTMPIDLQREEMNRALEPKRAAKVMTDAIKQGKFKP